MKNQAGCKECERTDTQEHAYSQYLQLLSHCADMRGQSHASVRDSVVDYGLMAGLDAYAIYWNLRFKGLVCHEDSLGAVMAVFKDWDGPNLSNEDGCSQ